MASADCRAAELTGVRGLSVGLRGLGGEQVRGQGWPEGLPTPTTMAATGGGGGGGG